MAQVLPRCLLFGTMTCAKQAKVRPIHQSNKGIEREYSLSVGWLKRSAFPNGLCPIPGLREDCTTVPEHFLPLGKKVKQPIERHASSQAAIQ